MLLAPILLLSSNIKKETKSDSVEESYNKRQSHMNSLYEIRMKKWGIKSGWIIFKKEILYKFHIRCLQ